MMVIFHFIHFLWAIFPPLLSVLLVTSPEIADILRDTVVIVLCFVLFGNHQTFHMYPHLHLISDGYTFHVMGIVFHIDGISPR